MFKEQPGEYHNTHQSAFDPMTGSVGILDCYNDRGICEILNLNKTVKIL